MFTTLVSVVALSTLAFRGVSAAFTIDTPGEIKQCQDVQLKWTGGSAPYDMLVVPADKPCDDILVDLGADHNGKSMTWKVALAAGTQVMFSLGDSTEDEAWTGALTVGASNDTSCLPASLLPSSAVSSSVAASSAASSAAASGAVGAITVSPTFATILTSAAPASSSTGAAVPVGAANAGLNPGSNGASSVKLSGSVIALAAAAVAFASL